MRNKQFIVGAAIILGVILLVLVIALFLPRGARNAGEGDENLFPDTSAERPFNTDDWVNASGTVPVSEAGGAGEVAPALRAISNQPTVGAVIVSENGQSTTDDQRVRFIERTSGNIVETALARMEPLRRLSVETMLRIGKSFWSDNGSAVILQRLDAQGITVYSFLGTLKPLSATTTEEERANSGSMDFSGRHINYENIVTAAVSPSGNEVFYIVRTSQGSVGYIENTASETRRHVWTSPLTNLTARWPHGNSIIVYTNPTSMGTGLVWRIEVQSGTVSILLGNLYALAGQLNPSGTKLLYSFQETSGGLTSLRVLDIASGDVTYLPAQVASLVEKCVWDSVQEHLVYCAVPRNITTKGYLEQWQYGLLASDDVLWQINTSTGEAHQVLDPTEMTGSPFDIVDLQVSPLGDFLVFRTRANDILWAARVPEALLKKESDTASSTEETL